MQCKEKVKAWAKLLVRPVDGSSLAAFRFLFGALMLWEVIRYFNYGRVERYYIDPAFHFPFFDFIQVIPGDWMLILFVLMGVFAICVAIGLFYRLSAILFFLSYTYIFLLDKAQYNNHYYLISLLAFLLIFMDANRTFSFDGFWKKSLNTNKAPFWNIFLLRSQMFAVYFFGGIAKLNSDWLLGEPMREWLANRTHTVFYGKYFVYDWAVYFFTYGGLLFDFFIGFLLLWKRTRLFGFILVLFFNLTNQQLFGIGLFPFLAIAATIVFVEPDWPRRVINRVGKALKVSKNSILHLAQPKLQAVKKIRPYQWLAISFVCMFLLSQFLFPLRHFLIPGKASWTEEGHNFAWHMKLRDKDADITITATNPQTGETWKIDINDDLTSRQKRKMSTRPHMIIQYAHFLRDKLEAQGIQNPIIKARVKASLNGRPYMPLIDPNANLAEEEYSLFTHNPWVVQLPTGLVIGEYY